MLIASVSDIHTDFPENRDAVVRLATAIHDRGADLVIIAGDISHRSDRIDRALRAFREAAETAYIPGNHDLWFDVPDAPSRKDLDTWHRYRVELKEIAEAAGAHYLPASPLIRGPVAVVGSCGWYDYSLAPEWLLSTVDSETLAAKTFGGVKWSDARFIAFRDEDGELLSDPAVARTMESELDAQLTQVESDPDVQFIVAVTHHQPFYDLVRRTGKLPWEYFNAFMGSAGLGKVIVDRPKVKVAIYGHSHFPGERHFDELRVFGTPLGYPRERFGVSDDELVETRIGWIDTAIG